MKYTVKIDVGVMIYIPNLIKISSGIQRLLGVEKLTDTDRKVISYAYFYFLKIGKFG
jgi:hypothetical protein